VVEAWTGAPAFEGQSAAAVLWAVVNRGERPPLPPDMPATYATLIQDCWRQEPSERPRVQDVLARLRAIQGAVGDGPADGASAAQA
jgi:hypothetical protein